MGRPKSYNKEIATEILARMCSGESVRSICSDDAMPARSTVMLWVANDESGFSDQYEKACMARAHYWADELLDIADDSTNDYMEKQDKDGGTFEVLNGENIQRARLRVDSRKWLLSKMLPRFADKQQIENTHKFNDISDLELENRIKALENELKGES